MCLLRYSEGLEYLFGVLGDLFLSLVERLRYWQALMVSLSVRVRHLSRILVELVRAAIENHRCVKSIPGV